MEWCLVNNRVQIAVMGAVGIARGSMADDAQFIEKIFGNNAVDYITLI